MNVSERNPREIGVRAYYVLTGLSLPKSPQRNLFFNALILLVAAAGLEPALRERKQILSLLCLPIPPRGRCSNGTATEPSAATI